MMSTDKDYKYLVERHKDTARKGRIGDWVSITVAIVALTFAVLAGAHEAKVTVTIEYEDAPIDDSLIHVSPAGDDSNSGREGEPLATIRAALSVAGEGDSVLLERGGQWDEHAEWSANHLTLGAYGEGAPPVLTQITIRDGHGATVDGVTVDQGRQANDALRIRTGHDVTLRNMEIRNGARDGIDVSGADRLLVENVLIHHFLAGSFTNQADAHGIAITASDDVTVRGVTVRHVSGDSIQIDPGRAGSTRFTVEDSHFWTGPLPDAFNEWNAGETPGENALDTKVALDAEWATAARMQITMRNITAHGWLPGYISNRAAFNLKEKVSADIDGVTVYDNELAFRVRGTRGNANLTLRNAVIYDNEWGLRAESNLADLVIENSTFGTANQSHFRIVNGDNSGTWKLRSNAFLDEVPSSAGDPSNREALPEDFLDADAGDYRLRSNSSLVDSGPPLPTVTTDRDGIDRPKGSGYDIGAYESH